MKHFLLALAALFIFSASNATPGLTARYYEGTWSQLPDFFSLAPIKKGTSKNVDLSYRNRDLNYAMLWRGYLTVPATGTYTFETNSDDGSSLYIGDYTKTTTPLISNDGLHAAQLRSATLKLKAGVYPIAISFFQATGGQTMEVYWSSTSGISRTRLPDELLRTDSVAAVTLPAASTPLSYSYYEGTWNTMPDFSQLTPVKTGTAKTLDLGVRGRDLSYAILWQGSITIPASGDYTFETSSDDGSLVYLGTAATPLVSNDGVHAPQLKSAVVTLKAGVYPIRIAYFQNAGGQNMELYWSSTSGISRSLVPASAFDGTITAAAAATTTLATGGLTGINNYYFSSSMGDDSRTSQQAKDPATPWKTLAKLNQVITTLQPGDAVLLKRGDTFEGAITAAVSGTQNLPVILSAYGAGPKPLITGLATLSSWTPKGNGIYESQMPQGAQAVTMVTMAGQPQALGRYPNITDANRGYLSVDAHQGNYSLTDAALSTGVNWTGAEVVIRKEDWLLDRCVVTAQSGTTLTYRSPTAYEAGNGQGYFIQNSPLTLDQSGEWYYDASANKLQMYAGQNAPAAVKASYVATLVYVPAKSYVTIDNISLEGAGTQAILLDSYCQGIRVQNCDIAFSGTNAITATSSRYLTLEANTITNSNNSAMRLTDCSYSAIRLNTITNSGIMPGMGQSNNQQMDGIYCDGGPYNVIESNRILNSGYCGITFTGDYTQVKSNFIDRFCMTVTDGGGIYTWGGWDKVGRVVSSNIILNGIGSFEGSSVKSNDGAAGIYLDDISTHVEVTGNTVAHCSRTGLYLHNAQAIRVSGNTLYDNTAGYNTVFDGGGVNIGGMDYSIRNVSFTSNLVVAKTATQVLMNHGSRQWDFGQQGAYDSNCYARPVDASKAGLMTTMTGDNQSYQDLQGWKEQYQGYDQHSVVSAVTVASSTNVQAVGANMFGNSSFTSNVGGTDGFHMSWDGGGHLDGGAVKVNADGATGTIYAHLYFRGGVVAGRKYLIRFSLLGTTNRQSLRVGIQRNGPDWNMIGESRFVKLSTTRTENEFMFVPESSEANYMLTLSVDASCTPYYLDNVSMTEVSCQMVQSPQDSIRFEYNEDAQPRTITLTQPATDLKGTSYQSQVTLAPYSSVILVNKAQQAAAAAAAPVSAAAEVKAPVAEKAAAAQLKLSVSTEASGSRVYIAAAEPVKVKVYNAAGAQVGAMAVSEAGQATGMDISSWSRGVYIVQAVQANGASESKRFVKL